MDDQNLDVTFPEAIGKPPSPAIRPPVGASPNPRRSMFASRNGSQLPPPAGPGTFLIATSLLVLAASVATPGLGAQEAPPGTGAPDRIRIGLAVGGTAFLGLVAEYQRGDWSGEMVLGTIGFRDLSLSLAGKRYLGTGRLRPVVGAGLWNLTAWSEEGEVGSALIFRVPLAVDWEVTGGHATSIEVGLNRALWVQRSDPEDDRPASGNIVPFPGLSYRHGWDR